MTHPWPWWVGGPALAGLAVLHWLLLHRQLAVSGRFTALVNRLRFGRATPEPTNVSAEELVRALRAATAAEFGEDVLESAAVDPSYGEPAAAEFGEDVLESAAVDPSYGEPAAAEFGESLPESAPARASATPETLPAPAAGTVRLRTQQSAGTHLLFLASVIVGAFLSSALDSRPSPSWSLDSEVFRQLTGGNAWTVALVLLLGGILVGFGTRMAGGCTSGHGLCGTSRLQSGSVLATAAFFGAGAATTAVLRMLL